MRKRGKSIINENDWKSEGERQIGMLFDRVGITYKYEYPLAVMDRSKLRIWYPDFQLPAYGVIIEYAGVTGDEGYDKGIRHKKSVYADNSIPAIFLNPDAFKGLWPERILDKISDFQRRGMRDLDEKMEYLLRPRGGRIAEEG